MLNVPSKLLERSDSVRVGVIGTGLFGENLVDQIERVDGMITAAVADIEPDKAKSALTTAGVADEDVTVATDPEDATDAIEDGKRAVLTDGLEIASTDIDVVVEATGVPNVGARHAYRAIQEEKHVVMVTVEADVVVGPLLSRMAESNDVTYTMAYGDQPSLIVELCDWAQTVGLDVVAAGKGNAYQEENRYGTPDDIFDRLGFEDQFVENQELNPRMWNSFFDGTKVAIEMCAVANATGLKPDVPGMHIPTANTSEIADTLRPEDDGGILSRRGIVDTVSTRHSDGSPVEEDLGNGMFVVTETPTGRIQNYLEEYDGEGFYTASDGQYQVFYRPFHLPGIETTVSIANAALRNEATGVSDRHVGEVVGKAKQQLKPGEEIDGGGGYTVYGSLESAESAIQRGAVPFELLDGAEVVREIEQNEVLTYDDVELQEDSFIYHLRQIQEEML